MQGLMKFMKNPEMLAAVDTSTAETMLPTENYLKLMQDLADRWPVHDVGPYQVVKPIRFFLATDKDESKNRIMSQFAQNQVVSFEKGIDEHGLRVEVWGLQLAVIDMFLLASCSVVIGTPFSTFSEAATYIGGALQLEPNFAYSNGSPQ